MNLFQDSKGLAALLEKAEQQDETTDITPQTCNLDDEECLTCGSQMRTITLYNENLKAEVDYQVPDAVFVYIEGLEESEADLALLLEETLKAKLQIHMN